MSKLNICFSAQDELHADGILSKGYGLIPKAVVFDRALPAASKAIYGYLSSYAGGGKTAFPSVHKILSDLKISKDKFYAHFKPLVNQGYIKIEHRRSNGMFCHNIYCIVNIPEKYTLPIPDGLSSIERRTYDTVRLHGLKAAGYGVIAKIPMCDPKIKIEAKALYCLLCALSGATGAAYPSANTIQYYIGICNSTCQKYCRQLDQSGYIKIIQRRTNGRFSGYMYYISDTVPDVTLLDKATPDMDTPDMINPDMAIPETGKPEMIKAPIKSNSCMINNRKKNSPSIPDSSTDKFATTDRWMDIIEYRKSKGYLPYAEILSSPHTIDFFVTTLLKSSNQYLDSLRQSYNSMIPSAIHSLLSSEVSTICGAKITPLQALKLIDQHAEVISSHPYISIDTILDIAVNNYADAVSKNKVHTHLWYMKSCIYNALATGTAGIDSDLSRLNIQP